MQINTYTVTLPTVTGATITPVGGSSSPVNCGSNYSFTVILDECYTNSTITVKANGTVLTSTVGTYTINNITANQTVTVEGVQINTYTVTLPTVTGATITPAGGSSSPVNCGSSYSFAVTLDVGYNQSTIIVKANGMVLTPVSGIYTISNIMANQNVTVEGAQINTYTITATAGANGSIDPSGAITVNHDDSKTFTAMPDNNYEVDQWKLNGSDVQTGGNTYTISNIQDNATVSVTFKPVVGIDENIDQKIQIYPNPTNDEIFVKTDLQIEKVEVYSIIGSLLISENNFKEKISVSALPTGIYFLKIHTDKGLVVKKVVKE